MTDRDDGGEREVMEVMMEGAGLMAVSTRFKKRTRCDMRPPNCRQKQAPERPPAKILGVAQRSAMGNSHQLAC